MYGPKKAAYQVFRFSCSNIYEEVEGAARGA